MDNSKLFIEEVANMTDDLVKNNKKSKAILDYSKKKSPRRHKSYELSNNNVPK